MLNDYLQRLQSSLGGVQPPMIDPNDIENVKAELLADAQRRGLNTNAMDTNPQQPMAPQSPVPAPAGMLSPSPQQMPATPPSQGGTGFMDFVNSPQGKGLLYGAGMGLLAKMNDRTNPIVPTALAGAEQYKKQDQLNKIGETIASSNLTPSQKAFVQAAFLSGDPKMMETAAKFLTNASNKPVSVGAGSALVDPTTGKIIFQNGTKGETPYQQERLRIAGATLIPVDARRAYLAQSMGMGYDLTEATEALKNNVPISDLAKKKGFDPSNMPTPIFGTTTGSLTQVQKRQQALEEINSLNPTLTDAIKPYSQRIQGYSIPQIASAIKGDDPDKQARFLAARALIPEMTALRARAMGAQVGIETLREITNSSMGHIQTFESLVTPDVYAKAQEYVDKWLTDAVTRANKVGLQPSKASDQQSSSSGGGGRTYDPETGEWS